MTLDQFKKNLDEFFKDGAKLLNSISELKEIPYKTTLPKLVKYDDALITSLKNDITVWQRRAKEAIIQYYGEDDYHTTEFIQTMPSGWIGMNYKREFEKIVNESLINVKAFAPLLDETPNAHKEQKIINTEKATQPIIINVAQTQNQSQNIAIEIFLESIKDEIPGKQFKELKAIAAEEKDPIKAKSRILDKIKSFGEDVLSNIVANIITNPNIWSSIIG